MVKRCFYFGEVGVIDTWVLCALLWCFSIVIDLFPPGEPLIFRVMNGLKLFDLGFCVFGPVFPGGTFEPSLVEVESYSLDLGFCVFRLLCENGDFG